MKSPFFVYFFAISLFINFTLVSNENDDASKKSFLRNLWEEAMHYSRSVNSEETDSLSHCAKSDYKYFSHAIAGDKFEFINSGSVNDVYAVIK